MNRWDPFQSKRTVELKTKYKHSQQRINSKAPKLRLFALILKKSITKVHAEHFNHLKLQTKRKALIQQKMCKLIDRNLHVCKILAWEKMKQNVQLTKHHQRYIKNLVTLANRFYLQSISQSFQKLNLFSERKQKLEIENIVDSRGKLMFSAIKRILQSRKQAAFKKLVKNRRRFRKIKKKLKFIALIRQRMQKQQKRKAFTKLMKVAFQQNKHKTTKQPENDQLQLQYNDMTIQLQNKNQSIDRLTHQLKKIREIVQQTNQNRHNISEIDNKSVDRYSFRSAASNQSRQYSRKNSFDNKSNKSKDYSIISQDYSVGSILGSSFVSFASKGSRSILDSLGADCNCHYRYKYYEYKSLHETSRNQLDILKKQLEVAKDLNQHFQNELKFYGQNQEDQQVQKLKQEVKESIKDRDVLREKTYKYQKYIASLKVELKQKMQQLYRKVKKDGAL